MHNKCSKCGVELLTSVEFEEKKPQGRGGLGVMDMSAFFELSNARNAVGVACAVCGETYCSGCMEQYAEPHPLSGGLACLECGGRMTDYIRE
jgi:DNA-directed RNA polymerase subunit RPC12/RpoP